MPRGKAAGAPTKPKQRPKIVDEGAQAAVGLAPAKRRGRPPGAAKPVVGHNKGPLELTEDQMAVLLARDAEPIEVLDKKIATLIADRRNLLKKAKSDGFTKTDIEDYLYARDPDNEEKIKAKLERKIQVYRWGGVPLGAQLNLFDKDAPAVDKARAEGKADGLAGRAANNRAHPSVPQHQAYQEGYDEGQGINRETLASMKKPAHVDDSEFEGRGPN